MTRVLTREHGNPCLHILWIKASSLPWHDDQYGPNGHLQSQLSGLKQALILNSVWSRFIVYLSGNSVFLNVDFQVAQLVENLPAIEEMKVQSLSQEDPLEKGMTTHSSILAWEIPWTEEPGGLQFHGVMRVGHDLATKPPPTTTTPLFLRLFRHLASI